MAKAIHLYTRNNDIVKLKDYLFKYNIDINIQCTKKSTALHYASRDKNIEIMKILLENGASVNLRNEYATCYPIFEILNSTVTENTLPAIKLILEYGVDILFTDAFGNTPLHYAVEQENIELIKLFINYGFDINLTKRDDKDTPLHYAYFQKNSTIINLLIKHGANQTLCNIYNKRAKEYL